jgi:protein TonB
MAKPEAPNVGTVSSSGSASGTWLGSQSVFDQPASGRTLWRSMVASLISHGGLLLLLIAGYGVNKVVEQVKEPPPNLDLVFLKAPGPGGGGGGSPQPAPAKKLEIPKPKAPEPVVPTPVIPPPVPPPPTLNAPVMTNLAEMLQASGTSKISAAPVGGGGSGGGIGPGRGNGLGPGEGGGTGGGTYKPGAGVSWPIPIHQQDPTYTSEAMRAKIQGTVKLAAVVQPNGTVDGVKVIRSLDRQYGLDQAAIDAAKKWRFQPCKLTSENKSVPCDIEMELDFRLH